MATWHTHMLTAIVQRACAAPQPHYVTGLQLRIPRRRGSLCTSTQLHMFCLCFFVYDADDAPWGITATADLPAEGSDTDKSTLTCHVSLAHTRQSCSHPPVLHHPPHRTTIPPNSNTFNESIFRSAGPYVFRHPAFRRSWCVSLGVHACVRVPMCMLKIQLLCFVVSFSKCTVGYN